MVRNEARTSLPAATDVGDYFEALPKVEGASAARDRDTGSPHQPHMFGNRITTVAALP